VHCGATTRWLLLQARRTHASSSSSSRQPLLLRSLHCPLLLHQLL
jgi:hypothetical protein